VQTLLYKSEFVRLDYAKNPFSKMYEYDVHV